MTMSIQAVYDQFVAKKAIAIADKKRSERKLRIIKREIRDHEKARIILIEIQKKTQDEIKERIEKLVTLAIRSVFEDRDFTFMMKFETKNNRVYATPVILEYGEEYDPEEDMGGGIIDIISIAFKIVLWHMEDPRKRNTIIVDEPFRFTGALINKAGHMLKFLSDSLNLQVIMVSHDDELINICDRVYKVKRVRDLSIVALVKNLTRKIKRRKK